MSDSVHPIRLLVADLDGTLLNSQHRLTPRTDRALRQAIEGGVKFTVATGKTFPSTLHLIERYGITLPVITNNGTIVFNPDGSVMWEDPIPLDLALESLHMARKAGLLPIIYAGAEIVTAPLNGNHDVITENVRILMEHYEPEPRIVDDLERVMGAEFKPQKIIFMKADDLDAVAEFQTALEARFKGRADVMRSGLDMLVEMLPHGVSKATALRVILDKTGIAPEETMTFGDNCNDLEMIRMAGIGVAMGHAPEAVRHGADYITTTNDEDGVGRAIEKFVLAPRIAQSR